MGAKKVIIIDYKLGNLFSVHHACIHLGMDVVISSDPMEIKNAAALILPGVGAFPSAMENMSKMGIAELVVESVEKEKPLFGVCLGLQMLFSQSAEFGGCKGLGIIPGSVVKLSGSSKEKAKIKVPHIGWNSIEAVEGSSWSGTPLEPCAQGEFQYFVHSYVGVPDDSNNILSRTNYDGQIFCSSVQKGSNVIATQFHPEKSGEKGIKIYSKWAETNKLI